MFNIILILANLCMCGQSGPAVATEPAVRVGNPIQVAETLPPPPAEPIIPDWSSASSNGRCTGLVDLLSFFSPGWDVNRMAGIAYRESRCDPNASNSCCSGVLQMHRIHIPNAGCGVYTRSDYYDPAKNICAAADLWREVGYSAWSQTS